MMKLMRLFCLSILLMTLPSCAMFRSSGNDRDVADVTNDSAKKIESKNNQRSGNLPQNNVNPDGTVPERPIVANQDPTEETISLKQARLMTRLEEIENELKRQREKIRLLEQGLLTGITPEPLKQSPKSKVRTLEDLSTKKPEKEVIDNSKAENLSANLPKPVFEDLNAGSSNDPSKSRKLNDNQQESLSLRMTLAKENYQRSRFGLAVSDFAGIIRDFGKDAAEGAPHFWLGKSYLGIKEFSQARSEFEVYLKSWPTGEMAGHARLELARAYVGSGLQERARIELRNVIKDFEGQEIADIAANELKSMQGNL